MVIYPVESGPFATIGYLIYCTETQNGVVIDVPLDSTSFFLEYIDKNKINLNSIFLTHTHWDHTADVAKLIKETQAKLYVNKLDEYRLIDPMKHTLMPLPFELESVNPDFYFQDGQKISIGNIKFEVRFTPGHTEGGTTFVIHNEKKVFAGDTLFYGSIGRVDLPGGSYDTLINSIREKLFTLDDDYEVYSGHGPKTTIGFEKFTNPFFQDN
ncbi:MAG: MBL fold metallo-hydrolase [Candidatus Kapabacteria bacterium]|nr:MBL fold metallo-hydrolase [Candidatus Kapabacteria bacterium]